MIDFKKMKFNPTIAVLLFLLVGSTLSNQNGCWRYGNCDPGPNCENNEHNHCWSCSDGGFISLDKVEDGKEDCENGSDEFYEEVMMPNNKTQKYGQRSCKPKYSECNESNPYECCGYCQCKAWKTTKFGAFCDGHHCI